MSPSTLTLLAFVAGLVLVACAVGALIVIAALIVSRHHESNLGHEDVRSILYGEPSWWARQNGTAGHHDDEAPAS